MRSGGDLSFLEKDLAALGFHGELSPLELTWDQQSRLPAELPRGRSAPKSLEDLKAKSHRDIS